MSTLQQYVSVIGGVQGLLLFILLISDSRVSSASKVLGVFCLLLASLLSIPFLLNAGESSAISWLFGWIFYFPASFGGLFYIYCRSALLDRSLKVTDLVHLLPLILCYVLSFDFLLYKNHEFRAWVVGSIPNIARLQITEYIIFIQAFFYLLITALMLRRIQSTAGNTLSNYNPAIFRWLWSMLLFSLVIWSVKAVVSFTNSQQFIIELSNILIVVIIYTVAIMQWRKPKLFAIDHLEETASERTGLASSSKENSNGALDADTRAKFFDAVTQSVEREELFRDSDLTLASLALATGLSTHHLSEVLNQHEGKNFYQFINAYRVSEVCKRLERGGAATIMDIAMDAGFSSKSTFNSIFKQITGSTPSQYRKNRINQAIT